MNLMQSKVKPIGEVFRAKREEMHLTLKEVENATSIRIAYLQALEEGRISHFLSNVYALGFLRQYATFLGFDPEKLSREFPEAFRLPQEKQEFAYGIGTLEMRGAPNTGGRVLPNVIWGSLFVSMLILAWLFARFTGLL